jgi:hypothetical protein
MADTPDPALPLAAPSLLHGGDEEGVRLWGNFAPEYQPDSIDEPRPTLAAVKAFVVKKAPVEERDADRLNLKVPKLIHDAIDTLGRRARVPENTAALWAVGRGLVRVASLPDVKAVLQARQAIADAGADDGQHEWTYTAGSGTRERLDIRHVGNQNKGRYMALKRGLQLQAAPLGTVVLMAGLVDAPISAGHSEPMRLELLEFQRQLKLQVRIVRSILSDLELRPVSMRENQLSWSQALLK